MESSDYITEEKMRIDFLKDSQSFIHDPEIAYKERIVPILRDIKEIHANINNNMTIGSQLGRIIRTRMGIAILRIEIGSEYRELRSAKLLQDIHEKREKSRIRIELEGKTNKVGPIGDNVNNKYWKNIDHDVYNLVELRYVYLLECLNELEYTDKILEQLSISYAVSRRDNNS